MKDDVREPNSALGAKSKYILVPSAKKNPRPVMLIPRPAKVPLRPGVLSKVVADGWLVFASPDEMLKFCSAEFIALWNWSDGSAG